MKLLVLASLALGGCWQATLYTGPRIDSSGHVAWEAGASFGAALPTRRGAVALSFDGSAPVPTPTAECPASGCAAARSTARTSSAEPRVTIRGGLEWLGRPLLPPRDLAPASSIGWRAGVYGGIEQRTDGETLGLIGGVAAVSPWVWYAHTAGDRRSIALGLQLATELTPLDGRVAGRAAIACDMHFLPRWR